MIFRTKYTLVVTAILAAWAAILGMGRAWILCHPAKLPPAKEVAALPSCASASRKEKQAGFRAKRDLALNHWIKEQDLDWKTPSTSDARKGDFISHYSACPIRFGELVIASEVWLLPKIEAASGHVAYPLPITDSRMWQEVNAGAKVDVWDTDHLISQDTSVLAILCDPDGASGNCLLVVDAAASDVSRLERSNPTSVRVILKHTKE
jgi:hypothetical protein